MCDFPADCTDPRWKCTWGGETRKNLIGGVVFYSVIVDVACLIIGLLGLLFTRLWAGILARREPERVLAGPQVDHNDLRAPSPNFVEHEEPKQRPPLQITVNQASHASDESAVETLQTFSTIVIETPLGPRTYINPNQSELLVMAGRLFKGAGYLGYGQIPCLRHVDSDRKEVITFDLICCTRFEKETPIPQCWYHRIPLLGMGDSDDLGVIVPESTRQTQLDRGLQAKKELEDSGWSERMGYAKIDFASSEDLQQKYGLEQKYAHNMDAIVCIFRECE